MSEIAAAFQAAVHLLVSRDRDTLAAVGLSFEAPLASTTVATVIGAPLGLLTGALAWRGRGALQALLQSLLAVPTVVVGLVLYMLLSRRGPLGSLDLLFTPLALILGQVVLALPVVAAHTAAAARALDPRAVETARALGAGRMQLLWTVASELRAPLVAAIAAAFGRVISEVGVAMMVGGNIRGQTRTMTTAIALETGKGDFALAIALGLVLLAASLLLNAVALRAAR